MFISYFWPEVGFFGKETNVYSHAASSIEKNERGVGLGKKRNLAALESQEGLS